MCRFSKKIRAVVQVSSISDVSDQTARYSFTQFNGNRNAMLELSSVLIAAIISPCMAIYTVFQKSDAKIQITITTAYLIRIKYPLSDLNYQLSDVNIANFNKIHCTVSEQQLFKNGTQKQKFPIWKLSISLLTALVSRAPMRTRSTISQNLSWS